MPYTPRIELAIELAMDSETDVYILHPLQIGEEQPLQLHLETSLYDTKETTIVFGIKIEYSTRNSDAISTIPSDQIYIFQQICTWKGERCHFVTADESKLAEQISKSTLRDVKKLHESLMEMCIKHHQNPTESTTP